MINFNDYQERAKTTAVYPNRGQGNWTYAALGLAGETGEICEKLKKAIRDDGGRISPERLELLSKELGDVLWYVSQLATELGLSLDSIAEANLAKLLSRKERNVLHGSGDDR